MDDITATRIEPSAQNTEFDKHSPPKGAIRKRETPKNPQPSPEIESDGTVEDIHRIDELA
jgi:hypothetical protein